MLDKLFSWSRNTLGFDTAYAMRGGFQLSLNQLVSLMRGLITTAIIVRALHVDDFGNYKYVISLFGVAGIFGLTGMGTAIARAVARGEQGMIHTALRSAFKWSWAGSIVLGGLAMWYFTHQQMDTAIALFVLALLFPFYIPSGYFNAFEIGMRRFHRILLVNVITTVLLIIGYAAMYRWGTNYVLFLFITIAVPIAVNFYFLWRVLRRVPASTSSVSSVRFGYHQSVIESFGTVVAYFDSLFILNVLGTSSLAIYSIADAIPGQLKSLGKMTGTLLLPKLSQHDAAFSWKLLNKFIIKMIIIWTMFGLGVALIAPYAIQFLFSDKYDASIVPSQIMIVAMGFALPSLYIHNYFQSQKMSRPLYLLNITYIALKIILFTVLTPLYGLWGAIGAEVSYRVVSFIIGFAVFFSTRPSLKTVTKIQ